jgi:dipicolinate synthase subunit A
MAKPSIAILGGDLRQCYTAEYLLSCGWNVTCFHTPDFPCSSGIILEDDLAQALEHADIALLPTPFSKDGVHLFQADEQLAPCPFHELWKFLKPGQIVAAYSLSSDNLHKLEEKECKVFQFSQTSAFAGENALLTAEGLLSELIRYTPFSLSSARTLLLGYGCCGSAIGTLLHPLCRGIYLLEQEQEKQLLAEKKGICPIQKEDFSTVLPRCNLVINTIPAAVLEPEWIQELPGSCHIFDIASSPYGFPGNVTENYLLPYFRLPGLPGRFSPVTAGQATGKIIERITDYVI